MEHNDLILIHSSLLDIMDEIDRICREHNLRYSLSSGSLLGAIRHQGIIPWDDDIDVCMPRADYDRFFEVCEQELGQQFGIITIDNKEDYGYGFSKVVSKNVKIRQHGIRKGNNIFELWIDVFPYDNIPDSKVKRFIHKYKNYFFLKLLEERYDGLYGDANFIKRLCFGSLHVLNHLISPSKAKKKLILNMKKYNGHKTKKISSISGYYGYEKESLLCSAFDKLDEYRFEGRSYLGFSNYDSYLKQLYKDYLVLPPEDRRHTHNLEVVETKI